MHDGGARERIVHAAKATFAQHGFRKTSLADIASHARMSKSSIYHYFTSKEELFRAIVDLEMTTLSQRVAEAVAAQAEPEARLRAFVQTRMRVAKSLANAYATLHEEYLDQLSFVEQFRQEALADEVDVIRSILEEGVQSGAFEIADPGLAAYAIALALKGLEYPWMIRSDPEIVERNLDLLLEMLLRAVRR